MYWVFLLIKVTIYYVTTFYTNVLFYFKLNSTL